METSLCLLPLCNAVVLSTVEYPPHLYPPPSYFILELQLCFSTQDCVIGRSHFEGPKKGSFIEAWDGLRC